MISFTLSAAFSVSVTMTIPPLPLTLYYNGKTLKLAISSRPAPHGRDPDLAQEPQALPKDGKGRQEVRHRRLPEGEMARAHQGQGGRLDPDRDPKGAPRRPDHPPGKGDPRGKFAKIVANHQRIGFAQALDGVQGAQGDADVGRDKGGAVAGAVAHDGHLFPLPLKLLDHFDAVLGPRGDAHVIHLQLYRLDRGDDLAFVRQHN